MTKTRKLLVFSAAFLFCNLPRLHAQENCETNAVFGGLPRWATQAGHEKILVLTNCAYIVGYSEARKDPVWVCYHLKKVGAVGQKAPNPPRKNNFKADIRTAAKIKYGDFDYKNTHLDAGHMAPSYGIGSRYGEAAQDETFLMSNMCPQLDTLNRRTWARLESKEADNLSNGVGEVWIIDGPVFDSQTTTIGNTGIAVPNAFYKIVIDGRSGQERVLAFRIFQTTIPTQNFDQFLTSVGAVENLTGLDFFAALPPALKAKLGRTKADHHLEGQVTALLPPATVGSLAGESSMKPLTAQDLRHLEAAQGWLMLGNLIEADAELDNITPLFREFIPTCSLSVGWFMRKRKSGKGLSR